jgi:hypothetical protein
MPKPLVLRTKKRAQRKDTKRSEKNLEGGVQIGKGRTLKGRGERGEERAEERVKGTRANH